MGHETPGRAAGKLSYVDVACTELLTAMHAGGRAETDIDAGGVRDLAAVRTAGAPRMPDPAR